MYGSKTIASRESDEAFEAVHRLLIERGEAIPDQKQLPQTNRKFGRRQRREQPHERKISRIKVLEICPETVLLKNRYLPSKFAEDRPASVTEKQENALAISTAGPRDPIRDKEAKLRVY